MHQHQSLQQPHTRWLGALRPRLNEGVFAYCTVPIGAAVPSHAVGSFRESEGLTLILFLDDANAAGLTPRFVAAWITLEVNSALESVGLTAMVSRAMADAGIPCNVVAAFHHDHLFVPVRQAQAALELLTALDDGPA